MFKDVDYDKYFVIGTPLVGWKVDRNEHMFWLENAEDVVSKFKNVKYFTALELDHRGLDPFLPLIERLESLHGEYWTYMINDKNDVVDHRNRLIRIETGRNLIREFAQRKRYMYGHHWGPDLAEIAKQDPHASNEAILYVDSDNKISAEIIEKMFEIDRPLVGVDVPNYQLSGKIINENPRIEEHWNTAGALLVNSPAFYDLVWHHNSYLNLSDDPSFQEKAQYIPRLNNNLERTDEPYGMTWVRKDVKSDHLGELCAVEDRKIPNRVI